MSGRRNGERSAAAAGGGSRHGHALAAPWEEPAHLGAPRGEPALLSAAREFPASAVAPPDGVTRREFLRLAGAGLALAGIGGCFEPPREKILPYAVRPPEVTPGIARYYATTMALGGFGTGLLVESHEGRPTKVEGNPDHPASLGAAGTYEQASVLQLYDPDRARAPRYNGEPRPWSAFIQTFGPDAGTRRGIRPGPRPGDGAGLRFLLPPTASPTTARLISRIRERLPAAGFTFYAPLSDAPALEGTRLALGRPLRAQYDFGAADVILALDADFLASMPFSLRYAREFADRRRLRDPAGTMNRLYVAEGVFSVTGGSADHRLRVRTGEIGDVAAAVLAEVAAAAGALPGGAPAALAPTLERFRPTGAGEAARAREPWLRAVARDLVAHAGAGIVITGERQPPIVHAVGHALNALLGNTGRTVHYTESPRFGAGEPMHDLAALVTEMRAGQLRTLVILGGNPSYDAPADLEFPRALARVPRTVYLGLYENETAADCDWFLPMLHYLESWGDARACDGTASPVQPLIAPLYDARTADEVLAVFLGEADRGAHALVRETWRNAGGADFETFWDAALERGVFPATALPPVSASVQWNTLLPHLAAHEPEHEPVLEVVFVQDARVYDGRFANNPWLQELPDPVTKLTWDNAALLSPRTAAALGVRTGDALALRYRGRSLRVPALILPGHADGSLSIPLGYGRAGAESVARDVGVDAFAIRTVEAPYFATGVAVEPIPADDDGPAYRLATTQAHGSMEGRPIVLEATLDEYRANPDFTAAQRGRALSLYTPFAYTGTQWAMTIDLGVCTGCSACVVACQAENNTPVVGKEGVLEGREMHWLRIDRYFTGRPEAPAMRTQPMLCQHCEKAPCEYVCPVNATVHSPDGLNEMIYNRCVGTRFCSNNCPYKVRRFNWFDYNTGLSETEQMQRNPDVTVRARGVMEKCTFCVQRIRRAGIQASTEDRPLRPDEVWTACQQACPTRAIVFGSLGDPGSAVSRTRHEPRSYAVLHELGTEPRVRYLARITNPAPRAEG